MVYCRNKLDYMVECVEFCLWGCFVVDFDLMGGVIFGSGFDFLSVFRCC